MIAEMHGKGIPVELIVSAVATFEEAMAARAVSTGQEDVRPVDTSTIDKRRAWDKERKRRQRELERLAKLSALSTGQSTGIHRNPPDDACIISSKGKESTKVEVKEKKESKRIARGTRVPPDFSIDDDDRKFAASLGIPPDVVEAETPQFIDYWSSVAGAKGVKLNWKATWRNRMRDLQKYQPTRLRAIDGQRSSNTRTTGHDAILAAANREAGKIVGDGEMAGSTDEAEFPFEDGAFGSGQKGSFGSSARAKAGLNGRESCAGGVLEGEIIPPDEAAARVSGGWRRH